MSEVSDYLNAGLDTALAIDRIWQFGGQRSSNVDLTKERIAIGSLNGSGPVNPADALAAARRQDGTQTLFGGGTGGGMSWQIGLVVIAGLMLLVFGFRRLR